MKKIAVFLMATILMMSCVAACDKKVEGVEDEVQMSVEETMDEEASVERAPEETEWLMSPDPNEIDLDNIQDGTYCGHLERITHDFRYAEFVIGTSFYLTPEEVQSFSEGQEVDFTDIGIGEIVVTSISQSVHGIYDVIFSDGQYYLYYNSSDGNYYLKDVDQGGVVVRDPFFCTVAIADGCQIRDFYVEVYARLCGETVKEDEFWEGTDFAECPWIQICNVIGFPKDEENDGWMNDGCFVSAVEITNGEVTYIELR